VLAVKPLVQIVTLLSLKLGLKTSFELFTTSSLTAFLPLPQHFRLQPLLSRLQNQSLHLPLNQPHNP
jgi:hypothetical protein